jgi:hypothetical protein
MQRHDIAVGAGVDRANLAHPRAVGGEHVEPDKILADRGAGGGGGRSMVAPCPGLIPTLEERPSPGVRLPVRASVRAPSAVAERMQ